MVDVNAYTLFGPNQRLNTFLWEVITRKVSLLAEFWGYVYTSLPWRTSGIYATWPIAHCPQRDVMVKDNFAG